jgi:mono/diheme cytochrome c family protein
MGVVYWYRTQHEEPQPSWIAATPRTDFLYGSIGAERTDGIPYWIWLVLPRLFPEYQKYPGGYLAVGMSWEEGTEMPIGLSKKTVGYVRVAANCALCHTASYRTTPEAVPVVVPAVPGHTVDLNELFTFLKYCADDPRFNASEVLKEIYMLTKLSWFDNLLYRFVLISRARERLSKHELILDDQLRRHQQNPYSGALFSNRRTKALADWMKTVPAPAYPLEINSKLVETGRAVYENTCAGCHALDRNAKRRVIPIGDVGTDRTQLTEWAKITDSSALGSVRSEMVRGGGYIAPSLSGIWLRAPYLHNGSVPSVRHLLEAQSSRPLMFYVGNDVVEPQSVGFVWTEAKQPGQRDFVPYDATQPGHSNAGHLYGVGLPAADKTALIEYIKTL